MSTHGGGGGSSVAERTRRYASGGGTAKTSAATAAKSAGFKAAKAAGNAYMNEVVNYGGIPTTRADVIRDLQSRGFTVQEVSRYMQGLDLGRILRGEGNTRRQSPEELRKAAGLPKPEIAKKTAGLLSPGTSARAGAANRAAGRMAHNPDVEMMLSRAPLSKLPDRSYLAPYDPHDGLKRSQTSGAGRTHWDDVQRRENARRAGNPVYRALMDKGETQAKNAFGETVTVRRRVSSIGLPVFDLIPAGATRPAADYNGKMLSNDRLAEMMRELQPMRASASRAKKSA